MDGQTDRQTESKDAAVAGQQGKSWTFFIVISGHLSGHFHHLWLRKNIFFCGTAFWKTFPLTSLWAIFLLCFKSEFYLSRLLIHSHADLSLPWKFYCWLLLFVFWCTQQFHVRYFFIGFHVHLGEEPPCKFLWYPKRAINMLNECWKKDTLSMDCSIHPLLRSQIFLWTA